MGEENKDSGTAIDEDWEQAMRQELRPWNPGPGQDESSSKDPSFSDAFPEASIVLTHLRYSSIC